MAASLNFPRELISHCLALKLLFQDILLWIFEKLNKGHCLWIWSAFLDTYIWIDFSLRSFARIDYERKQNWKIARSFCAKVLLRIISTKLFVLWQVLKPPTRKAISKKILRQRFYFFNLTLWLNYKKTGYPIFIDRCIKPVWIGLFQMPALFFYKNNFALVGYERPIFFFHANYRILVCNTTTKCFW